MYNSPLFTLSIKVSNDSVDLYKRLISIREYEIANQLKRSCTSIEANIREARYAESKKDFIHKIHIATKECNESIQWIRIVNEKYIINDNDVKSIYNNCYSLLRMLSATLKTSKQNLNNQ